MEKDDQLVSATELVDLIAVRVQSLVEETVLTRIETQFTKVNETLNHFSEVLESLDAVTDVISSLVSTVDQMGESSQKLRDSLTNFEQTVLTAIGGCATKDDLRQIEGSSQKLDEVGIEVAKLNDSVKSIDSKVDSSTVLLNDLVQTSEKGFEGIKESVSEIGKTDVGAFIDTVNAVADKVEAGVLSISNDIDFIAKFSASVDTLYGQVAELKRTMQDVEKAGKSCNDLSVDVRNIHSLLQDMNNVTSSISSRVAVLNDSVAKSYLEWIDKAKSRATVDNELAIEARFIDAATSRLEATVYSINEIAGIVTKLDMALSRQISLSELLSNQISEYGSTDRFGSLEKATASIEHVVNSVDRLRPKRSIRL